MVRIAIGLDGARGRLQVLDDGADARLGRVGAIRIAAAAVYRRAKATAAVAVLGPPVVGAGNRIRIFDFIYNAGIGWLVGPNLHVVGRDGRIAASVAEPDGIAETEHDAVEASAAHRRLVVVVAHCEIFGESPEAPGISPQPALQTQRPSAPTT